MKTKKFKINVFFLIIFFLIFTIKFDFFLNIYVILKNNSEARMISNYGYCFPKGYGFIQEVNSKYNLNDYNIDPPTLMFIGIDDIIKIEYFISAN